MARPRQEIYFTETEQFSNGRKDRKRDVVSGIRGKLSTTPDGSGKTLATVTILPDRRLLSRKQKTTMEGFPRFYALVDSPRTRKRFKVTNLADSTAEKTSTMLVLSIMNSRSRRRTLGIR